MDWDQVTQNLRQLGATELASSAGTVRELRKTQTLALVPRGLIEVLHVLECSRNGNWRNRPRDADALAHGMQARLPEDDCAIPLRPRAAGPPRQGSPWRPGRGRGP